MKLKNIIESVRQILIGLENIRTEVKELETQTDAEDKAKQRIDEMLSTAITGLLTSYDFLIELESCIDENDLELFLELSSETEDYN